MITLSSIEKSFDGSRVLKNINLTIEEGTVTTLIGPSGSGKAPYCAALICWKFLSPGS